MASGQTIDPTDTSTNGGGSSYKNLYMDSEKRQLDKMAMMVATTEAVTTMLVGITSAIYKGEIALAVELGSDNYTQVAQNNIAASERVATAMTEAFTALGREAIKAYAPIHAATAEADLVRAQAEMNESLK